MLKNWKRIMAPVLFTHEKKIKVMIHWCCLPTWRKQIRQNVIRQWQNTYNWLTTTKSCYNFSFSDSFIPFSFCPSFNLLSTNLKFNPFFPFLYFFIYLTSFFLPIFLPSFLYSFITSFPLSITYLIFIPSFSSIYPNETIN